MLAHHRQGLLAVFFLVDPQWLSPLWVGMQSAGKWVFEPPRLESWSPEEDTLSPFDLKSLPFASAQSKLYMMTSSHGRASRIHDDVIKWKHFRRNWPFVRRIHRSPVNSLHKGQWRGALMFSLICTWTNGWVNNQDAGDLRRHRAHYDVIVMYRPFMRGTEPLVSPCKGTVVQRFKLFIVVRMRKRFCNVI